MWYTIKPDAGRNIIRIIHLLCFIPVNLFERGKIRHNIQAVKKQKLKALNI